MSDTRLRIYLNDHLALSVGEYELANRCAGSNKPEQLGEFLRDMLPELKIERELIEAMLNSVGGAPNPIKEGFVWLAEKLGRLKMNDSLFEYSELSRLIEVDTLHAAAIARRCFWQNVQAARAEDERFKHVNFDHRIKLARTQARALRGYRLRAAKAAL